MIPETAALEGTVRTMDRKDRILFEKRVKEIAKSTATAYGTEAEIEPERPLTPLDTLQSEVSLSYLHKIPAGESIVLCQSPL